MASTGGVEGTPRFVGLLRFAQLQAAMIAGATVCYLLGIAVPPGSAFAAVYHPGSPLFFVGDVLFLTVPVALWMGLRWKSWPRAGEMAVAMIVPVALVAGLGGLRTDHLLWLVTGMYPLMTLAMVLDLGWHASARARLERRGQVGT